MQTEATAGAPKQSQEKSPVLFQLLSHNSLAEFQRPSAALGAATDETTRKKTRNDRNHGRMKTVKWNGKIDIAASTPNVYMIWYAATPLLFWNR